MQYSSQKLSEVKVFKDPVHRYVHVSDQVIWDLIGTKEFQRLRRVKQLGTTYLTFHGAEHSRFQHSLGVYEIIRRLIDDVFEKKSGWKKEDRLLALCAALLHDVGHGPFSHSFEKVFHCDHEEFSRRIILEDTEINRVLSKVHKDFPKEVAEVIEKTSENKLVVSMISSQIDADRMDYLLRDAYYTGVSYGVFDLERLLRVLRPHGEQVVVKETGMHAVEHYIVSRYQMYWQVYFHPVSRSAEVILSKIFARAKELHDSYHYSFQTFPTHFYSIFEDELTLKDYLRLDESVILYYFQLWEDESDPILSDLCKRFMNRNLFKYISLDSDTNEEDYATLKEIFKEAGIDERYYLVKDSTHDLSYDIYRPGEEKNRVPIYLQKKDGDLIELSRRSTIVEAITGKTQKDVKLFYPADILNNELISEESREKLKSILER